MTVRFFENKGNYRQDACGLVCRFGKGMVIDMAGNKNKTVVVGMSGGVDSSVAA